jgi:hypothetical protein
MLGQSVTTSFPAISIMPAGSPGQTPVLAWGRRGATASN